MADEKAKPAGSRGLDFSGVKDQNSMFNPKRQPSGDYRAKVIAVVDAPSKKDGEPQWLFTIQVGSGTYRYYCKLVLTQLWKLRNLLMAAGLNVPKQRLKIDPNKVVGREIGVTLDDEEYDDGEKIQKLSVISGTFPLSELDSEKGRDDEDEADDDDEEEAPAKKKKAAVVEDDDDDDEEEPAPKKTKKKPAPVEEDDDDDEEEDEPAPPKKSKKKPVVEDDDDELDELEIDL